MKKITKWQLKYHNYSIICRICGLPLHVGDPYEIRKSNHRGNMKTKYFHTGCIYATPKKVG